MSNNFRCSLGALDDLNDKRRNVVPPRPKELLDEQERHDEQNAQHTSGNNDSKTNSEESLGSSSSTKRTRSRDSIVADLLHNSLMTNEEDELGDNVELVLRASYSEPSSDAVRTNADNECSGNEILNEDSEQPRASAMYNEFTIKEERAKTHISKSSQILAHSNDHFSASSKAIRDVGTRASTVQAHQYTDVEFSRISHEPDFTQRIVDKEDFTTVAKGLMNAVYRRQAYCENAHHSFPKWIAKRIGENPFNLPQTYSSTNKDVPPLEKSQRKRFIFSDYEATMEKGVVAMCSKEDGSIPEDFALTDRSQFIRDRNFILALMVDGNTKSFCYDKLRYLDSTYELHVLMNDSLERMEMKDQTKCRHRDFQTVRKVDNHIHAAACMSKTQFKEYLKNAVVEDADVVVNRKSDGTTQTMREIFDELEIDDPDHISIDTLDVHADRNTFQRFDRFNAKYNPLGAASLRQIFLKVDNLVKGKYFAGLLKGVADYLDTQKYLKIELRLSIYGRADNEWDVMANWFHEFGMSNKHIKWMIQVPRLYGIFRKNNVLQNFGQFLKNIFQPVMEASLAPHKNPKLASFLSETVAFDSVDDESKEPPNSGMMKNSSPEPDQWNKPNNPTYTYYLYYMYANIAAINAVRIKQNLNVLTFRPHCGETGQITHLAAGFLLADNISHGIQLRNTPVLQYLYYLTQIGLSVSPLSNNSLFLRYDDSPFFKFLRRGLNCTLSTDDPLMFHFTREPLIEEYAIAAQVFRLSQCDLCEIARNSVAMSGFSNTEKERWLGERYDRICPSGNDISKTNVPQIRVAYRAELLHKQLTELRDAMKRAREEEEEKRVRKESCAGH